MESLLKRIERNRREHDRLIALILCLSLIVSMGTFAVFHKKAVAKTYIRQVLDCPLAAEGAGLVVHTHNDDCYDENHNLVCTLPELEAHTHSDACYTEVPVQVCGLAESVGHVHGSDCRTLMLTCEEEEREATLDEEGNAADAGHVHTPDCYSEVLSCGMEEGDGAHTHTDACYETEYLLTCDKPEVLPHVHSDDCYQKNEDGSIYVDEDGYSRLICGLPEVIQHAHGPECFKIYELDDGEPEETDEIVVAEKIAEKPAEDTDTAKSIDEEKTNEEESGDEENTELTETEEAKETTDTEDMTVPALPMPAQSWERTAGGIKVTVEAPEGAFPEDTRIAVTPVNGSSLMDTVSDAVSGEVLEVQAVDITFFDAEVREIEPAVPIRVVMTPAATEHAEEKANVVHVDITQQTAELIEQAAGTEFDNSEVVFDAEAFTIYAIVYTVHFEYEVNGQVYTSTVPGAQDKLLSELIRELNVVNEEQLPEFMTKIREVSFSNPEVLKITETEGDWIIRALKDSDQEEGLTIVMQDGATFSITVEAEGITEVSDENEVATVSTVNDLYLPASSEVKAELLTEEQSGNAIAAVQSAESSSYQTFSIALENVDVTAYDGFNVAVTLPEDAVIGRDFQLYQVKEDGSSTDLTESLTVTGETNEDGLQNVSGISFTTEDFADFVLGYSIETFYTTAAGDTYRITLNYGPKAGIPDGADLKVKEILPEDESYTNYLNESAAKLGVPCNAVSFARFFDIEIRKDDEKIEPKAPVQVMISLTDAPEENVLEDLKVLHFAQTGLETIDGAQAEQKEDATIDLIFETDGFSVYGVVYTVDFHYEINGKVYDFSIPGGGFISLEHLIEVLGINAGDADSKDSATGEAAAEENYEGSLETVTASAEGIAEAEIEAEAGSEDDSVAASTTSNYEQAINLNSVPVSEETRAFVENIETVEFSSPELVWVGKVDENSTIGALKESNGLEIEYSANLTEEQIAEINAQTVEAGDWALISVRPFLSEESLTVTMKNGDSFTIRVTDGQIRKTVIDARGDTWEITVTYGEDAQIPDEADLNVREILENTEEHKAYLENSAKELGVGNEEIRFARFFDISILDKTGEKVEPSSPVQVRIAYKEVMPVAYTSALSIVHFAENGIEVISELSLAADNTTLTYFQDSFSVTGTIISEPQQGQEKKYMVLVNYPNGSENYYIVNNDGTLTKVSYDSTNGTVDVEYPMLWTIDGTNPNRHIYFNTEATGFNYQDTAADYFRRYLDPSAANGITEENSGNITLGRYNGDNVKTGYVVTNRNNMLAQTSVNNYIDNGVEKVYHGAWNDNLSLGVDVDADGNPVRISGINNWGDAVNVVFAEARSVPGVDTTKHTVDHIDISISGKSDITVPLAYGKYYYKDSNGNWQEYVVTSSQSLHLEQNNVSITPEDMKHATIKAYNPSGDEVPDAFVIDGYSSNASNAYSTVQVRIGGRFKVADTYEGGRNDFQTRQRRLDNKITYSVSAIKPLTFDLKDDTHGQFYEKLADGTYRKMSVTVDVNMTASFDYWDERNECPGIKNEIIAGSHNAWVNGGIPEHGLSGMDFVLGGDAEEAGSNIVALEISKLIVDKDGERIKLAESENITNTFHIYCDADGNPDSVSGLDVNEYTAPADYQGYSKLHNKDIKVSSDGMGIVYDYDVTPGMYYVREDKDSIPDTIKDDKGATWYFAGTRIETEYVWRDQPEYDEGFHVSDTYTKDGNEDFNSIPEVLGPYKDSKGRTTYFNEKTQKEEPLRNGFAEFFVYNIYTKTGDVAFTKTNGSGTKLPGAVFGLYKKYDLETGEISDPLTKNGTPVTATSQADGTVSFSDLPAVNYYMKEISAPEGYVLNPKVYLVSVGDKTNPDANTVIYAADGTAVTEIINYPSPDNPDAPSAQVENHKRIDALRDGAVNPDSPHTGEDLTDLYRLYLDYKINSVQNPEGVDLLFVLDHSGSMNSYQSGGDPRRAPTIERMLNGNDGLIKQFLDMNENNRWAAVGFKGESGAAYIFSWGLFQQPNAGINDSEILSYGSGWNTSAANVSLPDEGATRLTDYTAGFWRAEQFLKNNDGRKKVIIFISDGLPTLYIPCEGTLEGADQTYGSAYYPAETGGCVDETIVQFQNFLNDVSGYGYTFGDNIELYTVGFGYDLIGGGGQTILDNMLSAAYAGTAVNASSHSFGFDDGEVAPTAAAIKQALGGAIGLGESFSKIVISDKLSKYVDIYRLNEEEVNPAEVLKAAGTKLTMTDPSDMTKTITLYENGAVTTAGNNILAGVSYSAEDKTVTASFKPDYKALPGITYTLSFDVRATDDAYSEYANTGYGFMTGDLDTDFLVTEPANATSTGKPGFRSNDSAKVSYDHEKDGITANEHKDYPNPVIQVFNAPIEFIKTDQARNPVGGATFNLYNNGFNPEKSLTDPGNVASKMNASELVSDVITLDDNTKVARIAVEKLKYGIYYLVETKAPEGYYSLEGPIKIEVKVDTKDNVSVEASMNGKKITIPMLQQTEAGKNDWRLKVANNSGIELPMTGGSGTALFTAIGGILSATAGAILNLTSCRRRKKQYT